MLLTAEGRFLEAAALLGSVTNMAEICVRICPSDHLCEGACILEGLSGPVSIQGLEQFLTEYAFAHGKAEVSTAPPNGRKVAVVGSGPGGLAAAEELAKKGYEVTIFDSALVPGGLLVNGIPPFKLDRSILQRRIDILKRLGVTFHLGVKLWEELTLSTLRTDFDAVFLGFDSRKAQPLEIPGADLHGVVQALPFLLQKTTPIPLDLPSIDVTGKKVVVLGAGDTAMDCLRAAIRYGAAETTCVYRRGEAQMPCGHHEYENAVEEGARFVFQAAPVAVSGDEGGAVKALRLVRTELSAAERDARPAFRTLPGTEFTIEADWVIPALGFAPVPCPRGEDFKELTRNEWGGIVVDANQMTSMPGIFAGGDIVRGPSLILHAVRDARRAATQIQKYLAAVGS